MPYRTPQRHHWVNTLVGVLDGAFHLSEEEVLLTASIFGDLLDRIDVPGRGEPDEVPAALALEVSASLYSSGLAPQRPELPSTRAMAANTVAVRLEDWRDALSRMIFRAYPDLRPEERLFTVKVLDELLLALGLPTRLPCHLPEDVISVYGEAR
jgi:hypothetical protein